MKQYRTHLLIVTFLFIGWTFLIVESCAQVKLTQVESDTILYRIPVAHRTIAGQPGKYFMKYMGLEPLMDSLDLKGTKIDSMTFASDTLKLYTNDGIFKVEILSGSTGTVTSVGLTTGTSGTDVNVTGSPITSSGSFTLNLPSASASNRGLLTSADHTLFSNKFTLPSLTSGSVLFSNGSTISQDNSSFFWDDTNNRLGLGRNSSLTARLTLEDAGGLSVNKVIAFQNSGGWGNTWISKFNDVGSRRGLHISGDNISSGETTAMTVDHFNGAKVGINNTTPTSLLHIGNASDQNGLTIDRGVDESISAKFLVNTDGDLIFRTTSGNVSIAPFTGTFASYNPSAPLHLFAPPGASTVYIFKIEKASGYGSSVMRQYYDGTTSKYGMMIGNGYSATNYLTLQHNDGFVGVGVDIPTRKLDVNGGLRIRDVATTTPTKLMSIDNDGVVSSLGLSGLSISGGNLVGAAPLSGTTGAIPYFTSTTALGSTPFTYDSNIMTIPTGNSIYFPGTATIIDKNSSGGSAGEFLSRASSGGGVDWIPAPTLSEVDGSVTNEGILGVSAGSGTTAVITSNTSGATGVTLSAGSNITISESTSTNGGTITIAGSFSEVDGSITNEGYTGVRAGGSTSSILQGYNSAGTTTGAGTTINAAGSISISETTSVNGGQITLDGDYGAFSVAATTGGSGLVGPLDGGSFLTFTAGSGMTITRSGTTGDDQTLTFASTGGTTNLSYSTKSGTDVTLESSTGADVIFRDGVGTFVNRVSANVIKYDVDEIYGQLNNTAIIGSATIDGVYRSVDFTVADESYAAIIDAKTASDEIEVLVAGTYEISYSLSYLVPSNRDVRWRIYKNTADIGYIGELTTTFTASHPSKTFNIALAANDKISLRFLGVNGVSGTIDINSPVLKVRRIK